MGDEVKQDSKLEWAADLASRSPEGSEEKELFRDAAHWYELAESEAQITPSMYWATGGCKAPAYRMRAVRRFKKAMALREARLCA